MWFKTFLYITFAKREKLNQKIKKVTLLTPLLTELLHNKF